MKIIALTFTSAPELNKWASVYNCYHQINEELCRVDIFKFVGVALLFVSSWVSFGNFWGNENVSVTDEKTE